MGRVVYTILFFLLVLFSFIFKVWGSDLFAKIPLLKICKETSQSTFEENICFGTLAIYRVTFVLAVFHLFMALITIGVSRKNDCRVSIQDGFWGIKILLLVGAIVGCFFIPNAFFEVYGWIALFASGLFILIQLLILVDFAHSWAENWITKMEDEQSQYEGGKKWFVILAVTTSGIFLLCLGASIAMYILFAHHTSDCGNNIVFITLNIILCGFVAFLSINPKIQDANPKSGLLQAAVVTGYVTYLTWAALMSVDNNTCNPFLSTTGASNVSALVGAIITIVAVLYSAVRASVSVLANESKETEEKEPLTKEESANDSEDYEDKTDPDGPVSYSFSKFHVIFALGAMYVAMLMSDWYTVTKTGDYKTTVDTGPAAMWVKLVSSWLCIILYSWTLLGPVVLPDRDWN